VEIIVRQAPEELAALQRRLRDAEARDLRRELTAGLRRATKPMQAQARRNASRLPTRGGYSRRVAGARYSTRVRGGRDPSVRLVAQPGPFGRVDLEAADSGLIRHMVFGQRDGWVWQRVNQGWWADAVNATAPQARREIEAALDDVAAKLDRRGRFG